ncbi:MAG: hypothetical protein ABIA62_07260 [Candidatus Woesearchaeota archaeon]
MLLIVACFVSAEPELSLSPLEFYETNEASFQLDIDNFGNDYEITGVAVTADGLSILASVDYRGWTEEQNESIAIWSDGSLGTNVKLAVFEYLTQAPLLYEDTTSQSTITIIDDEGVRHDFSFDINILNDDTAPELVTLAPIDEGFVKMGSVLDILANVTDDETAVENVVFSWIECNPDNETEEQESVLELSEGIYTNQADMSEYEDSEEICYGFKAYNKGGESAEQTGSFTIDGAPPNVTLVSPDDNAVIGLSQEFSFFSADNLAKTVTCSIYIDGNEYRIDIEAPNMEIVTIPSADLEEGEHAWEVRCTDPAGWTGTSAARVYTLDKTPPAIVMKSPENNSIIADSTELEFEVTDNYGLASILFVRDGNETEVESEFAVKVNDWPDGPNEFAVSAEDPVGNQAELTYRIIIDRTPPQVELLGPIDGDTIDVHVNFSYRVLDDYDEEMDCKVIVDDAELQQHTAQRGAETARSELLAAGDYTWRVQCVDNAGNSGESDTRQVTVVDLTGPDIVDNSADKVFRGDPVEISLVVTDISGVEQVTAVLVDPHGEIQTIPLDREDTVYAASVATTETSALGTYTLEVYSVDTLNHSNTATIEIEMTYKYVVALELDPATAAPGSEVTVISAIVYDNGSAIPEDMVVLTLPEGDVELELDQGSFSHAFTAPADEGTYDITAAVLSDGNSEEYVKTVQLTVAVPQVQSSSSGGSGGGRDNSHNPIQVIENACEKDIRCTAWTMCEDGMQEKTCVDVNKCDGSKKSIETRACNDEPAEEDDNDGETTETAAATAARRPIPKPEKYTIDATDEDEGSTGGIGKATGFMSDLTFDLTSLLIVLATIGLLLGILAKYGWSNGDNRKKPAAIDLLGKGDRLGLESYLNGRSSRRGRF